MTTLEILLIENSGNKATRKSTLTLEIILLEIYNNVKNNLTCKFVYTLEIYENSVNKVTQKSGVTFEIIQFEIITTLKIFCLDIYENYYNLVYEQFVFLIIISITNFQLHFLM